MADVMKYTEVKDLDAAAIDTKVAEIKKQIFNMKMEKATSGIEKPHALRVHKKNIAKLLTAKNSKK